MSTRLEPDAPAAAVADHLGGLAALGIEHAVFLSADPWTEAAVATLAEVGRFVQR